MDAHRANQIKGRTPLRPSTALRQAFAKRGKGRGSITYFFSAKNDKDIVVASDLAFAHVLLCEADGSVKGYEADADRVAAFVEKEGYLGEKPDVIVHFWSGRTQYREVGYLRGKGHERLLLHSEIQRRAAEAVGAEWRWFNEDDVRTQERLLHDWLHIAAVLYQSHLDVSANWEYLARWVLDACRKNSTLGELRRSTQDPWELVFPTIFRLVQLGRLGCDLELKPLSPATMITSRGAHHA